MAPDGKLVVSPTNAAERLLALIASTTKSIAVEAESLADTRIVASLTDAADAGLDVRVVHSSDVSSEGKTGSGSVDGARREARHAR